MPRPRHRTRSEKRRQIKLPGKSAAIHYKSERISGSHCFKCGRPLPGVPTLVPSEIRQLPASQRRPQRIYGGQLCHICLREALKQAVRSGATP